MTDTFSAYFNESYIPTAIKTHFQNTWWYNQDVFEIVSPEKCPGGPTINWLLDYSSTSNAEKYSAGAPIPTPETISSVRAYMTKEWYQGGGKVPGYVNAKGRGQNAYNVAISENEKAINNSLQVALAAANTTVLADLAAFVDATTAYSDASLARATYSIASYENALSGALTLAALEDMVEALENTTYGPVDTSDLVWLMPRNQITNLSRLTSLASNAPLNASSQSSDPIDAGRQFRTKEFEQIPIIKVPGMTTTEIYLVRRSKTKLYMHTPIEVVPKDVPEWANYWLTTFGVNLVIEDPQGCAKQTGVTA